MANWDNIKKKFQNNFKPVVFNMIENLGGVACTIIIPPTSSYDFLEGDINTSDTETDSIKVALIPTTKDDLDYIPEGFRIKDVRKIYSNTEITKEMTIVTDFDGLEFQIIRPSIPSPACELVHYFRTYVARIEDQ